MGSPKCRLDDGIRYRKTKGGFERCRKKDCPPYEKGKMNCWCCNGPDEHPVNGGWSHWSKWALNSDALNTRLRVRTCNNPAPLRNGTVCYSELLGKSSMHEVQCQPSAIFIVVLGGFIVTLILAAILLVLMLSKKSLKCRGIRTNENNEERGFVGTTDDDEDAGLTGENDEEPGKMYEECAFGGVSKMLLFNRTISERSTVNLGRPPTTPTTPTAPSVPNFEQASTLNINT